VPFSLSAEEEPIQTLSHYVFEKPSLLGWCQASEKKPDAHEIIEDAVGNPAHI
jgi:hypothetical protein